MTKEEYAARIHELVKLVHELMLERAHSGIAAFKEDQNFDRSLAFFADLQEANLALNKLLEALTAEGE